MSSLKLDNLPAVEFSVDNRESDTKSTKLPVIDFTVENLKPGTKAWVRARDDVRSALEEYGCFIAVYDRVSSHIHNAVFGSLEELFDLPTSTKVQNKSRKPLYGYMGQIPVVPLYESMGIDDSDTPQGIQTFTDVMWSNGNDRFSENMLSYTKLAAELEQLAVKMVFESYGVMKDYESHINATHYLCRVMKYSEPRSNETALGLAAHTDKNFMTVLHQNKVGGLEVKAKDGGWFHVELSPSSFVVMAGDAIMAWSNDRIHSPIHRVTMNGNEARYSIAQFSFMNDIVQVPEELVDDEHPLKFKPFNHLDYIKFYGTGRNRALESPIRSFCGV